MLKFSVGKGRSVYSMILLSYFAMILIFVVTGVLLMRQSDAALTAEIIAANQASMRQMQGLIDDELRGIERLCYEQSLDVTLNGLIYTQKREGGVSESKRRMSVVEVVQTLHTAYIANHTVDILYLFTTVDQEILTQNGKFSLEEFFQRYYSGQEEIALNDFVKLNTQTEYAQYITLPTPQSDVRGILYLYALPVGAREKLAVMGARIDTAALRGMMKSGEWLPNSEAVLLDQNGSIVLSSGETDSIVKQIPWSTVKDERPLDLQINGDHYTVMVNRSQSTPFRYGIAVPSKVFLLAQHAHMQSYMWGLVLMLIVSIAMALLMARVQYRPIRRLAESVRPPVVPKDARVNEYRLIEHRISTIKSENTLLSHANERQQEQLRTQRLISILHGMPADVCEIQDILRGGGMPMQHEQYLFLLISFAGGPPSSEADAAERKQRAQEPPEEVGFFGGDMQLILPEDVDLFSVFNRQMWYLLLNMPEYRSAQEIYQCCADWWAQHGGEACFLCMGRCFRELSELHQEFLFVSELREYQLAVRQKHVMGPDSMPQEEPEQSPDSIGDREKIDKRVIVTEAVALIQERYSDQTLSVTAIADEFGISQVALTRAFKHVLEIGVLDFIHQTRLDIAKQLIVNTRANLLDIAQQVGYTNNVTFIRVFKKYEGVTPSQYRVLSAGKALP